MIARTLRRPLSLVVAVFMIIAMLLVPCAASAASPTAAPAAQPGKKLILKLGDSIPPTHINVVNAIKPWMARVTELTNGKVEFQYYGSEMLFKQNDALTVLKTGVCDIVYTPPSVLAGDFPLHPYFALPGLYESSTEGTKHYQQLLKEGPLRDEFTKHGIRPMFMWVLAPSEITSVKKPVARPEDVQGFKIRSQGGFQDVVIKTLNAVPVLIPSPDIYTGLQRGTVDATIGPYTGMTSYRFFEVAKYATRGARLGASTVGCTILESKWQTLPADIQAAMMQANEEIVTRISKFADEKEAADILEVQKQGMQVHTLTTDEQTAWVKALAPVYGTYIKEKGVAGQKIIGDYNAYKKAGR